MAHVALASGDLWNPASAKGVAFVGEVQTAYAAFNCHRLIRAQSQAAVVGTLGAEQTVVDGGSQVFLRPLSVDRVLEGDKSLTGTTVYIVFFYQVADDLSTGNSYVAFLTATPEPGRYYLSGGGLGLLDVVSNSVTHSCVDPATGKRVAAVGASQGESLHTFAQQLKQNPVVPDSAASH